MRRTQQNIVWLQLAKKIRKKTLERHNETTGSVVTCNEKARVGRRTHEKKKSKFVGDG